MAEATSKLSRVIEHAQKRGPQTIKSAVAECRPHRRRITATFTSLLNFTDQGIRNIKDSPDRYGAFRANAEKPA